MRSQEIHRQSPSPPSICSVTMGEISPGNVSRLVTAGHRERGEDVEGNWQPCEQEKHGS